MGKGWKKDEDGNVSFLLGGGEILLSKLFVFFFVFFFRGWERGRLGVWCWDYSTIFFGKGSRFQQNVRVNFLASSLFLSLSVSLSLSLFSRTMVQ